MSGEADSYVLGAIALLTLCSLLTRAGYFLFGDHLPLTDPVRRALRYAPVAALTAIIVPDLLPWEAGASAIFDVKMLAAAVAVLIYWRTRSTIGLMVGGMCAYWAIAWLL
ncbi:AzlD domain-containing protein [Pusillimonas noertemannii]|uniref:Branched-subunit amino acid transport protein n=1 Tax=Pusillimonas noertemannii TaxID=305977 RepID=A0A2U1CRH5_9BURK|nr:AzlD domain-containing protein [Pusillimonas noertemannii]NYT67824.1 AzlD domain-containing protein [Pusillimonas noertemannii]PVY68495.1 branched-subunit amino acid transport protein [Pusillimonas noertemannii]TFL12027.1 AzlD domain-containing protein [Pusillimonas noertemannii]